DPMPETSQLLGTRETRHLGEPARRVPLEESQHALARRQPAEPPDRVEDGQVRLALAEVLDALTARHPGRIRPGQAGQEGLDDRRLPDARLAGDEHHLALAALGPRETVEEPPDRRGSPDDRSGRRRRRRAGTRRGRPVRGDLTDEAKPASMHGLDESGPAGIVPEDAADLADARGERRLAHRHIGPHGGEELVLRHELTPAGPQEIQYGAGPPGEAAHAFPAPQARVPGVDA